MAKRGMGQGLAQYLGVGKGMAEPLLELLEIGTHLLLTWNLATVIVKKPIGSTP